MFEFGIWSVNNLKTHRHKIVDQCQNGIGSDTYRRRAIDIGPVYNVYIGPPRFLCLAMMCTGAYTAAPLVDSRSENGGQHAQTTTVGIIRFVTPLF